MDQGPRGKRGRNPHGAERRQEPAAAIRPGVSDLQLPTRIPIGMAFGKAGKKIRQISSEGPGIGGPIGRRGGERLVDDPTEDPAHPRSRPLGQRRAVRADPLHRCHDRPLREPEGAQAGEQLMEDDAERPDVGAGALLRRTGIEELRSDRLDRSHQLPGARHTGGVEIAAKRGGDAEVDDLRKPVGSDENVPRLEVAVNDAPRVGDCHASADVAEELDAAAEGKRVDLRVAVDRQGIGDELHHKPRQPFAPAGEEAGVVDAAQRRVGEGPEDLELAEEALRAFGVEPAGALKLHRHRPRGLLLDPLIHPSHAPLADDAHQPHASHGRADERIGGGVGDGLLDELPQRLEVESARGAHIRGRRRGAVALRHGLT